MLGYVFAKVLGMNISMYYIPDVLVKESSPKGQRMTDAVLPRWHAGRNLVVKTLICLETPH